MASIVHTVVLEDTHEQANFAQGSLFFVGAATVLLRYAGFTILTDPNFLHMGDYIHLGYGLKSMRLLNPALDIDELPPLDMIVLSHMHEDHFDRLVSKKLAKHTPIVTTRHAAKALQKKGFHRVYALATWGEITLQKGDALLHITAMPGKHGPGPLAKLLPPVMGSMLEFETITGKNLFRLYITGDTLIHNKLKEIPKRYPDIDLALLHLGGTRIFGVMVTMDGEQGARAIEIVKPREAIPIHLNDYSIFKSSLDDFHKTVVAAKLERRVRYLMHGETYTFAVPANRR